MKQFPFGALVNWILLLILVLEEIESKGYAKVWRVHSKTVLN